MAITLVFPSLSAKALSFRNREPAVGKKPRKRWLLRQRLMKEINFSPPITPILSTNRSGSCSKSAYQEFKACPFGPVLVEKWNLLNFNEFGRDPLWWYPICFQKSLAHKEIPKLLAPLFEGAVMGSKSGEASSFKALVENNMVSTIRRISGSCAWTYFLNGPKQVGTPPADKRTIFDLNGLPER